MSALSLPLRCWKKEVIDGWCWRLRRCSAEGEWVAILSSEVDLSGGGGEKRFCDCHSQSQLR